MIGELFNKGFAFILIPILTSHLSVSEFGELAIIDIVFSLLSIFVIISIQNGFVRFYNEHKTEGQFEKLYSTAFIFALSLIAIELVLVLVLYKYILLIDLGISDWDVVLWYIFFRAIFSQLSTFMLRYYALNYKAKEQIVFNFAKAISSIVFISYFLILESEGIVGVLKGYLIGEVVLFVLLFSKNYQKLSLQFDSVALKQMLSFSMWAIPGGLSYLVLTMSDKYFISQYLDMASVGLYALAFKIGMILTLLFITPFSQVFNPFKYENWDKENANDIFNSWFFTYNFIGIIILLLLSMNSEILILVLSNSEYLASKDIIPLILFSTLLYGMTPFYTIGIQKLHKNHFTALMIGFGAIVNIGFNILFIQMYGLIGAAIATTISFLIINFGLNLISTKLYDKIKYRRIQNIFIYVFAVVFLAFYELLKSDGAWVMNIVLSVGLVFLFGFISYFGSKTNQNDIKLFLNKVKR